MSRQTRTWREIRRTMSPVMRPRKRERMAVSSASLSNKCADQSTGNLSWCKTSLSNGSECPVVKHPWKTQDQRHHRCADKQRHNPRIKVEQTSSLGVGNEHPSQSQRDY